MKQSLTEIVRDKQKTKKELSTLKNRYLAIIYGGVCRQESAKEIHERLFRETINQKKAGKQTSARLLALACKSASVMKKKTEDSAFVKGQVERKYGIKDSPIATIMGFFAFDLMKKGKFESKMSSEIKKEADKNESEGKGKAIDGILDQNREESSKALEEKFPDTSKIMLFYLASAHKDSASDHAPYQGKMYIDEKWDSIPMPYSLRNAIAYYVKTHDVKTVQWVMGKPVWFITRPNCRHYLKELSVKEVLATSRTKLLEKYDMKTAIGDRQYLQTIKHSTSKEWYDDVRNAQLLLESYKERLSLHEQMYKENPCALLKQAIEKDKMLITKWEAYISDKTKS